MVTSFSVIPLLDIMDTLVVRKIEEIANIMDPPIRRRKACHKDVIQTILSFLKAGLPWRYLQEPKATYHTYFKRFDRWMRLGVFERVWKDLLSYYSSRKLETNYKWFKELFIDTTMVKNIGGCDCLGKNPSDRGRLATKVSVICDWDEVPISCSFFPANQQDITTVVETVDNIACKTKRDGRTVLTIAGDKAYTSKHVSKVLISKNIRMVAPLKTNARKKFHKDEDMNILRNRWKIEHVFCRLDKFRRIQTRHDKRLAAYAAFNYLAMAVIVDRKLTSL
jgi:putative transposase